MTKVLSREQEAWAFAASIVVGIPLLAVVVARYTTGENSFLIALLMAAIPAAFGVIMWWGWYEEAKEYQENLENEKLKRRGYQAVVDSLNFDSEQVSFKERDDLYRYRESVEMVVENG